jgi:hypothetical protein
MESKKGFKALWKLPVGGKVESDVNELELKNKDSSDEDI